MLASDDSSLMTALPSSDIRPQAADIPRGTSLASIPILFAITSNGPAAPTDSTLSSVGSKCSIPTDLPPHTKALVNFMKQLHLQQYTPEMLKQGYDDLNFLSTLQTQELQRVAHLAKMLPGHAAKFVFSLTNASAKTVPSQTACKKRKPAAAAGAASASSAADIAYVVCIVDRSGSMRSMGSAVKTGFNEFLQEQKAFSGDCVATVVRFDHEVEVVHHGVDLNDIEPATDATFAPRGRTALYDGIGQAIAMVNKKISTMSAKPKRIMALVLTDGEENGSRTHSHSQIMKTIAHCEKELGWTFVFVGANQDAIATGTKIGFSAQNCLTFASDSLHQRATWSSVSDNFCRQRSGGSASWLATERHTSMH